MSTQKKNQSLYDYLKIKQQESQQLMSMYAKDFSGQSSQKKKDLKTINTSTIDKNNERSSVQRNEIQRNINHTNDQNFRAVSGQPKPILQKQIRPTSAYVGGGANRQQVRDNSYNSIQKAAQSAHNSKRQQMNERQQHHVTYAPEASPYQSARRYSNINNGSYYSKSNLQSLEANNSHINQSRSNIQAKMKQRRTHDEGIQVRDDDIFYPQTPQKLQNKKTLDHSSNRNTTPSKRAYDAQNLSENTHQQQLLSQSFQDQQNSIENHPTMVGARSFASLNTSKFLRTNLDEYFTDHNDRCIGCQECMKSNQKLISYKYAKGITSTYASNHNQFDPKARQQQINYDKEKLAMRIKNDPKRDFTTVSQAAYLPYKVELQEKSNNRNSKMQTQQPDYGKKPGDNNGDLHCFLESTTYGANFANWGGGPQKSKKPYSSSHMQPMGVKFDAQSHYHLNYAQQSESADQSLQTAMQRQRTKEYSLKQKRGNLQSSEIQPFKGTSHNKETYQNRKDQLIKSVQCKPVDELFVSHHMKMEHQTEKSKEYGDKSVDRCKYLNTKSKPTFI